MRLGLTEKLDVLAWAIIDVLSCGPHMTVEEISEKLDLKALGSPSLPTIYRRLLELLENQVLVRYRKRYAVSLLWSVQVTALAKRLHQFSRDSRSVHLKVPMTDNASLEYRAPSLMRLDPIWNDLMVQIAALGGEDVWYVYNAHPWFYLGSPETEMNLCEALAAENVDLFTLFGQSSLLDRHGAGNVAGDRLAVKTELCPDFATFGHGYAVLASNNYVIDCSFPPAIVNSFHSFFAETKRIDDFELSSFKSLFHQQGPWTLRVRRSQKKAREVRGILAPHFSGKVSRHTSQPATAKVA